MSKTVITGIVCGIAGVLLGVVLFRNDQPPVSGMAVTQQTTAKSSITEPSPSETRSTPKEVRGQGDVDAQKQVESLRLQLAQLAEQNRGLQASRLSGEKAHAVGAGKITIPKRLIPQLRLEAIGEDYGVGQDVREVLEITDAEVKQLEDMLIRARAQLDELELTHSTVVSQSETSVTLSITPFASEGGNVRSKLVTDVKTILGDERAGFFMEFARQGLDDRFNHFGQAKQDLTVAREADGNLQVDSKFKIETPSSTSSGGRSQTYGKDKIPENFRHLFEAID